MSYLSAEIPLPSGAVPSTPQAQALYAQTQALGDTQRFIVSNVTRGRPELPANQYTGRPSQDLKDYWKVTCSFAKIKDRSVDFYFEQEAEARAFSKDQVQTMPALWKGLDPLNAKFVSVGVARAKRIDAGNRYTDRVPFREKWHALLWCEQYGRYADLWLETPAEVGQYSPGVTVLLGDLLLPYATTGQVPYRNAVNLTVPPAYISPLVTFKVFVVAYPAAVYADEEYFTGGYVDTEVHGVGLWAGGQRPAGYNFGSGVYYDEVTTSWQRLLLTPQSGTPITPPGPEGLGTGRYVEMVAARKAGTNEWTVVYVPRP